jgi:hypothetical protein
MTPENGSPVLNVTCRMSPAFAPSGFLRSNKRRLAPVGSRTAYCASSTADTGSLQACRADGGGSWIMISRFPVSSYQSIHSYWELFTHLYLAVTVKVAVTRTVLEARGVDQVFLVVRLCV